MDEAHPIAGTTSRSRWTPKGTDQLALILQGGGALGAYQAGVYEALHEQGLEPNWIAGVSIGGITAAIIAGNRHEHRSRGFAISGRRFRPGQSGRLRRTETISAGHAIAGHPH